MRTRPPVTSAEEQEASFHVPTFAEVLSRLAHEVREARKVSEAQLEWFKTQTQSSGQITTEQLNKRLAELLFSIQGAITRTEDKIMATQAELAADLKTVLAQQQKTSVEIAALQAGVDVLNQKIVDLEAVVAAGGDATPELTEAVAAVKAQAQVVDDQIPDAPAPV